MDSQRESVDPLLCTQLHVSCSQSGRTDALGQTTQQTTVSYLSLLPHLNTAPFNILHMFTSPHSSLSLSLSVIQDPIRCNVSLFRNDATHPNTVFFLVNRKSTHEKFICAFLLSVCRSSPFFSVVSTCQVLAPPNDYGLTLGPNITMRTLVNVFLRLLLSFFWSPQID